MHFTTEQASEVKAWMVKKLEDISDADPEILTEYCWAILQSDASDNEIRKNAIENLEDFLKEHTVKFVDEIFARYAPKSVPSTTPAPTKPVAGKQPKNGQPIQSFESASFGTQRASERLNAGRKRSHHDTDSQGQDMHYDNGVASKTPRSRKLPKDVRPLGRNVSSQQRPSHVNGSSHPFTNVPLPPTPPPGFAAFDPNNLMAAYAFMQTMFPQMAGMPPPPPTGDLGTFGRRLRCQDYDTKGFCVLGSSCPYEHGNDSIVAPGEDEYDPTRANFSMNGTDDKASKTRTGTTRTERGNVAAFHARSNNRAAFSDPRLPSDKKLTSIVVEQIPEEYFEDETVRRFFCQYGTVLDVTMKLYKRLAIVKYDTHTAAKRAWESPKAVFDNRFVKVYWYRPDLEHSNGAKHSNLSSKDSHQPMEESESKEDFKQQQEEKQKAHEERMRIKKAMEDARQDLIRRRENTAKEHKALVRKLAIAEGKEAEGLNGNGLGDAQDGLDADAPDPKIKALRDQLAKMEAEAKSLGIDPDAPLEDLPYSYSGRRRGFVGPTRAGFSARAAYRGYGSRGGYQWRQGFVRGRDPSVRKLDNRPKNIAVSGVEFDNAKEENLRSYLTLIGPFEGLELNPQRKDSRIIVYAERWMAEQVMKGQADIPGVGKVEMSWVANTARDASNAINNHEDVVSGGTGNGKTSMLGEEAHQPADDDLDVAGGDDDDWGIVT